MTDEKIFKVGDRVKLVSGPKGEAVISRCTIMPDEFAFPWIITDVDDDPEANIEVKRELRDGRRLHVGWLSSSELELIAEDLLRKLN